MTSSLVGSEMCIRDSNTPWQSPMEIVQLGPRVFASRCGIMPSETDTCTPVSYTHLTLPTICSV
eukprot:3800886-Prorocentrum_lima.AAC.1